VLAAVALAVSEQADGSAASRQRAIARAVREVSGYLGNTPAVARTSYIDPRVIEQYEEGRTIARALGDLGRGLDFGELSTRGGAERAVLQLLRRGS
jgi:DNA topoisomerase I